MINRTSDTNLWKAFQGGDQNAFRLMYQQHYNGLYHYALKVTQSKAVSEDCLQNLFVNLWINRKNLSEIYSIKPYLFKSLRRDLKRVNYSPILKKDSEAVLLQLHIAPNFSPEDIIVEDETKQHLQKQIAHVLNKLPARQKEVVYLKYYEELEYKEIAQIMGVHYQSVVNLLFKAMTFLKKEENLQKLSTLLSSLAILSGILYYIYF